MVRCGRCSEENPERAKFCLNCGAPLVDSTTSRHEVRKTVTIVFADVTGSTNLGEQLDPESLRRVMERYFDEMRGAVDDHGGIVEKFIGDAVMAVFGLPVLHEDDALRATRAAADMRQRLADLNQRLRSERGVELRARIGVNTGEVVAGDPSAGQALVTGDAVNVAARLEQAAEPGQILVGEETYRLVHASIEVEGEALLLAVKGKELPVTAYALREVERIGARRRMRMQSPMLGRDRERDLVLHAFDRATKEARCHLFTILGSAGVGKSRLTGEVLAEIEGESTVYSGRCLSYGRGNTFWPIQEIVKAAADLQDDEPIEEARRKILGLLDDDDAGAVASVIEQTIGLAETSAPIEDITYSVRRLFETLAKRRPLVVLFDDIHWAEPALLDLIEHIADWSRDAPILLMCTARPDLLDLRPAWGGGKLNASSILLEPLDDANTQELVEHLLGGAGLDGSVRERILAAAEGNPLFIEEMIEMLVDGAFLTESDAGWRPTRDVSEVVVPPTIQALLAARLDLLGSDERAVIEAAAVVGQVFYRAAVDELVTEGLRSSIATQLMSLVRKEMIREERPSLAGGQSFKFRHILIQDAAYNSMPKETRALMHERFARWLVATAGDRLTEFEEIVAHHLEQAYKLSAELSPVDENLRRLSHEAIDVLLRISERALARDDVAAAEIGFGRIASLMSEEDPRLSRILRRLSVVQRLTANFEESRRNIARAIDLAQSSGNKGEIGYCTLESVDMITAEADPDWPNVAEKEAMKWREFFSEQGDDTGLTLAYGILADVALVRCRWMDCLAWSRLALEHGSRAKDKSVRDSMEHHIVSAYMFGPIPARAALDDLVAMDSNEQLPPTLHMQARLNRGPLHAMLKEFGAARQLIDEASTYFAERGHAINLASLGFIKGPIEQWAGNLEGAIDAFYESHQHLLALGERGYRSTIDGNLALLLARAGRFEEAERFALEAREITPTTDDVSSEMLWRAALAVVRASQGVFDEAIELAADAVRFAETTDFCNEKADVLLAQADVHQMAGDHEQVVVSTKRAVELYELKGNLAGLELIQPRLRALLERS